VGYDYVAVGAFGLLLGQFAADLFWIRGLVRAWPIHAQLIDWQKVERVSEGTMSVQASGSVASKMRFSIRDVLWLTVLVALGMGWWLDHRHQREELLETWTLMNRNTPAELAP
jgi:hypothetical protein